MGRIEAFRFRQDKASSPDEAKTLRQASVAALAPHFHLRADRFYNAPDTEIDFTEQGGLMWGEQAVGRLARGDDPLKPGIVAFVDEEAGPEVVQKVERRLQHFIDRKVAALFEPLLAMQKDEALEGLARGFAYRLVESMGVIPRGQVAREVRDLDQPARGALRKHGVRFGQFTVFLPALLKPAPTRLRLVLWSLAEGFDTFPESPPPGLVTIPVDKAAPEGSYAMAGYRRAGERAIRIDMLERLADLLRAQDTRGGFEASPDMLSITGMTLEQFADLMRGLGYHGERGERAKVSGPKETPKAVASAAGPETPAEPETPPAPDTPGPGETPPDPGPASDPVARCARDAACRAAEPARSRADRDAARSAAGNAGRHARRGAARTALGGAAARRAGTDADDGGTGGRRRRRCRPGGARRDVCGARDGGVLYLHLGRPPRRQGARRARGPPRCRAGPAREGGEEGRGEAEAGQRPSAQTREGDRSRQPLRRRADGLEEGLRGCPRSRCPGDCPGLLGRDPRVLGGPGVVRAPR